MNKNLHNDKLENFFRKSFDAQNQKEDNSNDNWDLPADGIWDAIAEELEEDDAVLVPFKSNVWRKWLSIAAGLLFITFAFCYYQNQQLQLRKLNDQVHQNTTKIEQINTKEKELSEENKQAPVIVSEDKEIKNNIVNNPLVPTIQNTFVDEIKKTVSTENTNNDTSKKRSNAIIRLQKNKSTNTSSQSLENLAVAENNTIINHRDIQQSTVAIDKNKSTEITVNPEKNNGESNFVNTVENKNQQLIKNELAQKSAEKSFEDKLPTTTNNTQNPTTFGFPDLTNQGHKTIHLQNKYKDIPVTFKTIPAIEMPKQKRFSIGIVQGFHRKKINLRPGHRIPTGFISNTPKTQSVHSTGLRLAYHINDNIAIEGGCSYGFQQQQIALRERFIFREAESTTLPDGSIEARTSVNYYSDNGIESNYIVIKTPDNRTQLTDGQSFRIYYEITSKLQQVRIPLSLNLSSNRINNVKLTGRLGIIANISTVQRTAIEARSPDIPRLNISRRPDANKLARQQTFDAFAGIGLEVPVSRSMTLSLEPSYSVGLNPVDQGIHNASISVNSFNVHLGAYYNF